MVCQRECNEKRKTSFCKDCNKKIRPISKRCQNCNLKKLRLLSQKKESREKIRISKLGEKNPNWKGDNAGYVAIHIWVKNNKTKPKLCEDCNVKEPYDLANISGEYKRDINDFEWLCRSCHMKKDGRIKNLKRGTKYGRP